MRGKFIGLTSYNESFHPVKATPVKPFRCQSEMSMPSGDIIFTTTNSDLTLHKYGRPMIHKPRDNNILCEESEETPVMTRASTSYSNRNYNVLFNENNNHLTGYENMSKTVESTLSWKETRPDMRTTNKLMYPKQKVTPFRKVDRNDFVKYVDFGFDSPIHETVYGGDFKELLPKKSSPVLRKGTTVSLEGSSGIQESTTSYVDHFQGKPRTSLPTLTEMDAHLRSSIQLK